MQVYKIIERLNWINSMRTGTLVSGNVIWIKQRKEWIWLWQKHFNQILSIKLWIVHTILMPYPILNTAWVKQKCYSDISKFANRCFPTWIMNKEVRNGKRINRMKGKSEFIFKKKKRPICATLKQPNSYYAFDHCTLYFENVIQMYVWNWDMTEFITVLRLHRMYAIDK